MPRSFVLTIATLVLSAAPLLADEAPSFINDVVPLLTKLGCNQGACHGKAAGQNGFRLSLRGYAPEQDHASITREFSGRRINPAVPEESLLLQKPLGLARHEGGKLLAVGSREYQVLLDWLRAGAPGPRAAEPKLENLSLTTRAGSQKPGDTQALKVEAHFSDGSRSDVTWLTRFDSNDAAVVTVSSDGTATIRGHGETALRASFQSEVATAIVSVPFAQTVASERFKVSGTPIDEHV